MSGRLHHTYSHTQLDDHFLKVLEKKKKIELFIDWIARFSSLDMLQRVTVRIYRLINKARRLPMEIGPVTCSERHEIMKFIIKYTQNIYFSSLLTTLRTSKNVTLRSIAALAPFIDETGIIRVGGRLRHSTVPIHTRHPVLLPKSSTLTTLLIRHTHIMYYHAGPQLVWSILSRQYWILASRSSIRKVLFYCVNCARHKPTMLQPAMADLPAFRVSSARVFLHVGVDFAGPMLIKEGKRKNARAIKCYISIFVCMAVKAVHIEVVSDLSTEAFLAALHRFISRRGLPSDIYSDCATNFKGADDHIRQLLNDLTVQERLVNSIHCTWHFNPPAAPHFGGLWEAAVKSCKYHLKRVVGNHLLNFEELTTLMCRIEAILNSRPLTTMSSDPNELAPLTPAHFLISQPFTEIPEPDITLIPTNRLQRWHLIRQLHQNFWKRWSSEYLVSLQNRPKWTKQQKNIQIGDLVIVHAPNQPPTQWKMGRVEAVHTGADGTVRVATVRTAQNVLKRPVVKLALVPINDQ